jgi:hypothetical protein
MDRAAAESVKLRGSQTQTKMQRIKFNDITNMIQASGIGSWALYALKRMAARSRRRSLADELVIMMMSAGALGNGGGAAGAGGAEEPLPAPQLL